MFGGNLFLKNTGYGLNLDKCVVTGSSKICTIFPQIQEIVLHLHQVVINIKKII